METYMTEEYTGNKLYKVMYGETVSYLCADSTAPINGVEITQEEWDTLEVVLKERKEINPPEPDTEQAVVDSIMQEVSSYGY